MSNYSELLRMKLALKQKLAALQNLREDTNLKPFGVVEEEGSMQPGHLQLMRAIRNFQLSQMLAQDAPTLQEMLHPNENISNPEIGVSTNFIPITDEVVIPDRLIIERNLQRMANQRPAVMNLKKDLADVVSFAKSKGKKKIGIVLGEYKRGTLKSSSGKQVKNRKQALAIALSEMRRNKRKKNNGTKI